jgi:hypothetical protein
LFRKLLREPLLHFLLLGLLLFLLYNVVSGRQGGSDRRIVITDAEVASLVQTFQGTWQRPPTLQELRGLIDSRIREEVLYREGAALGLDRDDTVIRRRVLQKLDVISEESQSQQAPSDAVLGAWLQQHAARYAQPAVLDFEQVLFDPVRHGERLKSDVEAALARLRAGADPAKVGDASMLPTRSSGSPADMVARDFGEQFASALVAAPLGVWQGPVTSGYGVHLVRVSQRVPGHPATLADVRAAVERDWESDRRNRAKEDYYHRLRRGYSVVIEAALPAEAKPGSGSGSAD